VDAQTIEPVPAWSGEWLFCPISSLESLWVQLSSGYRKLQGVKVVDQLGRDRNTISATTQDEVVGTFIVPENDDAMMTNMVV